MKLDDRSLRRRAAISTVLGTMIFLIVALVVFATFEAVVHNSLTATQANQTLGNQENLKEKESLVVTKNSTALFVQNTGSETSVVVDIFGVNSSGTLYTENVSITVAPSTKTTIPVVTADIPCGAACKTTGVITSLGNVFDATIPSQQNTVGGALTYAPTSFRYYAGQPCTNPYRQQNHYQQQEQDSCLVGDGYPLGGYDLYVPAGGGNYALAGGLPVGASTVFQLPFENVGSSAITLSPLSALSLSSTSCTNGTCVWYIVGSIDEGYSSGCAAGSYACGVSYGGYSPITIEPGKTATLNFASSSACPYNGGRGFNACGSQALPSSPSGSFTVTLAGTYSNGSLFVGTENTGIAYFTTYTACPVGDNGNNCNTAPPAGPPKGEVDIDYTGFTSAPEVLWFNSPTSTMQLPNLQSCKVDVAQICFDIPANAKPGYHQVAVTDGVLNYVYMTVYVTTPSVSIQPTQGSVGATVTVSGSGFDVNQSKGISIAFEDHTGSVATCASDYAGSIGEASACTFDVPASGAGTYNVTATDESGDVASATFVVQPNILLSPTGRIAGQSVTVTGTGFTPGATVKTLTFNGVTPTTQTCTTTTIDSVNSQTPGSFACTFTVPAGTLPGTYTVSAGDGTYTATAQYVVPSASLTLAPLSGPLGTSTTLSGSNFADSYTYSYCYESGPGPYTACQSSSVTQETFSQFTSATSSSASFTNAVTQGDLLVVTLAQSASTSGVVISGGCASSWAQQGSTASNTATARVFACSSASGGTTTISASWTTSVSGVLNIYDARGYTATADACSTGDGTGTSLSTASTSFSGSPLLVAIYGFTSAKTATVGSGFTSGDSATSSLYGHGEYATSALTSPTTFPMTASASATWAGVGCRFSSTSEFTTTGTGTIPANIVLTIPEGASTGSVVVYTPSPPPVLTAIASFTVIPPSIVLSPSSGNVNVQVTIASTSNFAPDSAVTVTFDGSAVITSGTCTTSSGTEPSGGVLSGCTFKVPPTVAGSATVTVTDTFGNVATATFTTSASITISPASPGPVGTSETVSGSGFASQSSISIDFSTTVLSATCTTNNVGSFSACSFTIPSGYPTGSYSITASDGTNTASSVFVIDIVQPLQVSLATAGPTGSYSGTVTGSGCTVSPSTITFGGSLQDFAVSSPCALTITVPSNPPAGSQFVFAGGSESLVVQVVQCSGTCAAASGTAYYQFSNTPKITAQAQSTFDSGFTLAVNGTVLGVANTPLCTITTTASATAACSSAQWVDDGGSMVFGSKLAGTCTNCRWENAAGASSSVEVSSGGGTLNVNYYKQYSNTYQVQAGGSATFDGISSFALTGPFLGTSGNVCTITPISGTTSASCSGVYSDANSAVTLPQFASGSPTNTRWQNAAGASTSITVAGGGNTYTAVVYYEQLQNTYQVIPSGSGPPAWDSPSLVQHTSTSGTNVATVSLSFGSNVQAGDILLASIETAKTVTGFSCSDTLALSWQQLGPTVSNTAQARVYYAVVGATGGADKVTCVWTTGSNVVLDISEWSGITATGLATVSDTGDSATVATSSQSFSGTPLLFAAVANSASETVTAGAGFTLADAGTLAAGSAEYASSGVSSPSTFPFALRGSTDWAEIGVVMNQATVVLSGTYLGASSTICTIYPPVGTTGTSSCTAYADYDTAVTAPSLVSVQLPNARWSLGGTSSFTDATGGNAHSFAYYKQLQNTYEATPLSSFASSHWDSSQTIAVTGTVLGSPSTAGYCALTTATGGGAPPGQSCYFDYNTIVTLPSPVSISSTEQWLASGASTFQQTSGGSADNVNYNDQFQVSFSVSPTAGGTTSPSGTGEWETAGSLSISATPNAGYAFNSWSSSGSITITSPASASTTATISGTGTITASFKTPSTTSVACSPSSLAVGSSTSCTATVIGNGPTGTVTWATSGIGTFTTSPCTLSGGSCSVTYKATSAGSITITATYSGDSNNAGSSGTATLAVSKASPTIATTVSGGGSISIGSSATDSGTFSGGYGTLTGTLVFQAFTSSSCSGSASFTSSTITVSGNGPYTSSSFTPSATGTYYFQATFTDTDGNNNGFTSSCGGTGETLTVSKASPTIATTVSGGGSISIGSSATDTATLSGAYSPTGSITFAVYTNSGCTTLAGSQPASGTISGTSATSGSFTPPSQGTYYWIASYAGDANNNPVTGACQAAGETLTVGKATPTLTTTLSATTISVGGSVSDTATLGAAYNPSGTITFYIFSGGSCSGTGTSVSVSTVTANGKYTSSSLTSNNAGSYSWDAVYSGDTNNNGVTSGCETLTVNKLLDPNANSYKINEATSGTSLTLTGFSTSDTNDLIYACEYTVDTGLTLSVSGGGLTWTERTSVSQTQNHGELECWYAIATSTLSSVTFTLSSSAASGGMVAMAFAVSGVNTATPFDTHAGIPSTSSGRSTSPAPSASFTTGNPTDVIIGIVGIQSAPTSISAGSGYTPLSSNTGTPAGADEYEIVSSTGTFTPSFTLGSTQYWVVIADAIDPSPSAGAATAAAPQPSLAPYLLPMLLIVSILATFTISEFPGALRTQTRRVAAHVDRGRGLTFMSSFRTRPRRLQPPRTSLLCDHGALYHRLRHSSYWLRLSSRCDGAHFLRLVHLRDLHRVFL